MFPTEQIACQVLRMLKKEIPDSILRDLLAQIETDFAVECALWHVFCLHVRFRA